MFKKFLLTVGVFLGFIGLTAGYSVAQAETISIKNVHCYGGTIAASINYYGDGASSSYFDIPQGREESWDREDQRGNIIAIKDNNVLRIYYSRPGVDYLYYDGQMHKTVDPTQKHDPIPILKTTNNLDPKERSSIKVNNFSSNDNVSVAINPWEEGDSSIYYGIGKNNSETWGRRKDPRGYLISVNIKNRISVYYARGIGVFNVTDDGIKNSVTGNPLKLVYYYHA